MMMFFAEKGQWRGLVEKVSLHLKVDTDKLKIVK